MRSDSVALLELYISRSTWFGIITGRIAAGIFIIFWMDVVEEIRLSIFWITWSTANYWSSALSPLSWDSWSPDEYDWSWDFCSSFSSSTLRSFWPDYWTTSSLIVMSLFRSFLIIVSYSHCFINTIICIFWNKYWGV